MELLTINDTYRDDQLAIFLKHGIKYPKIDQIVELLRIDNLKLQGKIGLIVSPYQNQWIIDKGFEKEVSFDKDRFTTLLGEKLTNEMIQEEIKNRKQEKVLVKPLKSKENDKNIPV